MLSRRNHRSFSHTGQNYGGDVGWDGMQLSSTSGEAQARNNRRQEEGITIQAHNKSQVCYSRKPALNIQATCRISENVSEAYGDDLPRMTSRHSNYSSSWFTTSWLGFPFPRSSICSESPFSRWICWASSDRGTWDVAKFPARNRRTVHSHCISVSHRRHNEDYSRANSTSSSLRNFADGISAGRKTAAKHPNRKVTIPSRMKIQRQPAKPPTPSIFMIAVASSPGC